MGLSSGVSDHQTHVSNTRNTRSLSYLREIAAGEMSKCPFKCLNSFEMIYRNDKVAPDEFLAVLCAPLFPAVNNSAPPRAVLSSLTHSWH